MRAVLQRAKEASVRVDEKVVGEIRVGLVVLLGVARGDTKADAEYLAAKVAHLRIFPDAEGKMNRSLLDARGEALVVSQFTLYGDCRRGRRPSFDDAAPPAMALPLYEHFVESLRNLGLKTETGVFKADMMVSLINDGPVTLICNSGNDL